METQHTCRCPGLVLVDDRPPPPPPADHPGVTSATDSACGLCSLTNCTTEQFLRQRLPEQDATTAFELRLLALLRLGRGDEGAGAVSLAGFLTRKKHRLTCARPTALSRPWILELLFLDISEGILVFIFFFFRFVEFEGKWCVMYREDARKSVENQEVFDALLRFEIVGIEVKSNLIVSDL